MLKISIGLIKELLVKEIIKLAIDHEISISDDKINGTGHTDPSVFCAARQNAVLRRSPLSPYPIVFAPVNGTGQKAAWAALAYFDAPPSAYV